jgi:predicted ATPase
LSNAIRWSFKRLSGEEQKVFAYLCAFSDGFSLGMAETMLAPWVQQRSVADHVASLLDKSLIQRAGGYAPESRFSMLAVLQEFGRERLRESGEATEVGNAHLALFTRLAEQADQHLRGPEQAEWLE